MKRRKQWAEKSIPPDDSEPCQSCGAPATQERIRFEGARSETEHYCDDCAEAILTIEDFEDVT